MKFYFSKCEQKRSWNPYLMQKKSLIYWPCVQMDKITSIKRILNEHKQELKPSTILPFLTYSGRWDSFLNDKHYLCNLNDKEMEKFSLCIKLLNLTSISQSFDSCVWCFDSQGSLPCRSFFHLLSYRPASHFPLDSYIWKARVPYQIRSFVWSLILDQLKH